MSYSPPAQQTIRDKSGVEWVIDGENGDETVLNRPTNDVADMVMTLRSDAIVTDPSLNGLTSQTVSGPFTFTGNVSFTGGSSASDDAVAMAIALG